MEEVQKAEIVKVIKIELVRGTGTKKDPARVVTQYWDLNGNFINDIDNIYPDETITSASSDIKSYDKK